MLHLTVAAAIVVCLQQFTLLLGVTVEIANAIAGCTRVYAGPTDSDLSSSSACCKQVIISKITTAACTSQPKKQQNLIIAKRFSSQCKEMNRCVLRFVTPFNHAFIRTEWIMLRHTYLAVSLRAVQQHFHN
jgi:hypothetical protein